MLDALNSNLITSNSKAIAHMRHQNDSSYQEVVEITVLVNHITNTTVTSSKRLSLSHQSLEHPNWAMIYESRVMPQL